MSEKTDSFADMLEEIPWQPPPEDTFARPRMIIRLTFLVLWTMLCLIPALILALAGKLLKNPRRVYPMIRFWAKYALRAFGLRLRIHGKRDDRVLSVVSNHISFLDVLVHQAVTAGNLISKIEVKSWPLIGKIGTLFGTQYIIRDRAYSKIQAEETVQRLRQGNRMIFYPEGTTTTGFRLLPFKSTFFSALVHAAPDGLVQPITLFYNAPQGASPHFYGWWLPEIEFLPAMLAAMKVRKARFVDVYFSEPILIGSDRRALKQQTEDEIKSHLETFVEKSIDLYYNTQKN